MGQDGCVGPNVSHRWGGPMPRPGLVKLVRMRADAMRWPVGDALIG
jgi:hypothetical protein